MPIYSSGHVITAAEFNAMMPVGAILPYGGSAAPSGWLLCDGSAVSRTTYSDLFSVIGTTFGAGDGSTTFNVPDSRGRVVVHKNSGTFNSIGATGGEETHTLSAIEMPSHTHAVSGSTGIESASHSHTISGGSLIASYSTLDVTTGGASARVNSISEASPSASTESSNHTHSFSVTSGSAGSGSAHNNLQPYIVMLGIIRY